MGLGLGEKSRTYVFLQLYVDSRFRLHRRLSRKRSLAQAKLYSYAVAGACITLHLSMCDKHTQPLHIRRRLIAFAMPSYSFSPHPHAVFENLLKSPSSNLPIAMDGISSFSAPPTAPAGRKCARTPCQLSARSWRIRTMSFSQPTRNAAVPIVLRRL